MTDAQPPFTLLEGEEPIDTYASKDALFSEIEAPDIDRYTIIDAYGNGFLIQMSRPITTGLLEKLANMLGAPARLRLVPLEHEM